MVPSDATSGYVPWWQGDWRYWFYFIAHSVGGLGLSLLLLTMCLPLRRVRRNPILISMCLSWWLGSFPNLTLLFFTNNVLGTPPDQATCLASAALVMAQTPLNAVCAVTLVYNVWSVLYFNSARSSNSPVRTFMLVIIPYVVFLICAGAVLAVGFIRPDLVGRATFYCVVKSNILMVFLGIFGGACCIVAIALEIWIAILLRQNRNRNAPSSKSSGGSGMDVQLAVRVILFGFYIFAGLALSIVSILNWTSVIPDLCFSTFSIAVFAIFGSQKDILRVWQRIFCCCFVKSEQDARRSSSHIRTTSVDPASKGLPFDGRQGHNPYWYRSDKKDAKHDMMGDLATLHTRNTTQGGTINRSPYNSHTDFQFQYESDVGLGLVGNAQGQTTTMDSHKAGKKSKDAWWGGGKNGRPGTGNSSKRPGTGNSAKRPGTAGSNFGETSMSWYPDLGYDFVPEGTSHTHDTELEQDVATASRHPIDNGPPSAKSGKGHANPHTRHSSATVPSEYIGTSPRSPEFIYYQHDAAAQSVPQLTSPFSSSLLSSSPTPLLANDVLKKEHRGFMFPPPIRAVEAAHAPAVQSRLHLEHHMTTSTDTTDSISRANDSQPHLPEDRYRDSTNLPDYYLREHSHQYVHSTDYRSSADSSIGGGMRAVIKAGATTLYDSDERYGYTHSNLSTAQVYAPAQEVYAPTQVYAPPPKSAFDRENTGFEFISGRKRTGSPDSFQTNPSLYGGRGY